MIWIGKIPNAKLSVPFFFLRARLSVLSILSIHLVALFYKAAFKVGVTRTAVSSSGFVSSCCWFTYALRWRYKVGSQGRFGAVYRHPTLPDPTCLPWRWIVSIDP